MRREDGVEDDGVAGGAPEPGAGAGGRSFLPPQPSPTPIPRHPPDDGGEEEEDREAIAAWVKHHRALPTLGTVELLPLLVFLLVPLLRGLTPPLPDDGDPPDLVPTGDKLSSLILTGLPDLTRGCFFFLFMVFPDPPFGSRSGTGTRLLRI